MAETSVAEEAKAIVRNAYPGKWPTATRKRFRIEPLLGGEGIYYRISISGKFAEHAELLKAAEALSLQFKTTTS